MKLIRVAKGCYRLGSFQVSGPLRLVNETGSRFAWWVFGDPSMKMKEFATLSEAIRYMRQQASLLTDVSQSD